MVSLTHRPSCACRQVDADHIEDAKEDNEAAKETHLQGHILHTLSHCVVTRLRQGKHQPIINSHWTCSVAA
jgi:hypothetical protein